jgi:hypothetical protein
MFLTFFNALFGCTHQRTTFPLTPGRKAAPPTPTRLGTYVVCLDCGKEFAYDWQSMRVGDAVPAHARAAEAQPSYR